MSYRKMKWKTNPKKKKKKKKNKNRNKNEKENKKQLASNPQLPNELLLSCFARVSRLYYPTLSLVSKQFRSLIASPELYKVRSLSSHTETCLYVCFKFPYPSSVYRWFTLSRKPEMDLINNIEMKKNYSGYVLTPIRILDGPPLGRPSGLVAFGSSIYNICGALNNYFSSMVTILDCRSNTWCEAPSLRFDIYKPSISASVHDGKIYVVGIHLAPKGSMNDMFEVFDTETQIWDSVPNPCIKKKGYYCPETACFDGKFHLVTKTEVVAYSPKEGRWDVVEHEMYDYMDIGCYCVIENVLYATDSRGRLVWYDSQVGMWRRLEGLIGIHYPLEEKCFEMADYGGKMALLWGKMEPYHWSRGDNNYKTMMIMCAVIVLERPTRDKILGIVEWYDHVLTVPITYAFKKVLAVTL